jgi:hypothetical protein
VQDLYSALCALTRDSPRLDGGPKNRRAELVFPLLPTANGRSVAWSRAASTTTARLRISRDTATGRFTVLNSDGSTYDIDSVLPAPRHRNRPTLHSVRQASVQPVPHHRGGWQPLP